MLFTTPEFFVFLTVVLICIELFRKQLWQHLILLGASYYFYWYSGSIHIFLLLAATLISYYCGQKIYSSENIRSKKVWLTLGTGSLLIILGYFKYIDFGIITINSLFADIGIDFSIGILDVVLPIGISFFTFQALSYIFDLYLNKLEPEPSFHKYALFIAFFPSLIAGPIVRASEFLPQLRSKITITGENIQTGVTLIIWGLFKKIVIADNIGILISPVFANPAHEASLGIIFATILFGIQIYCDFSGYAHIAIGIAKIMGISIPENFNMPYLAKNVQLFWRKWNMTLSRFIQDYVYIPLGGNRKGHFRTYCNLLGAMLICGLWHGAAWTFIAWGGYHGILLALHRYFCVEKKILANNHFINQTDVGLFLKIVFTQILVFFGWLIFRANTWQDLTVLVYRVFCFDWLIDTMVRKVTLIGIPVGIIGIAILLSNKRIADYVKQVVTYDYLTTCSNLRLRYWILYIFILGSAILVLAPPKTPEFIYFAF